MSQVFLSYSRADAGVARELFAKLKRRGFQIWFDEEALLPGQIWEHEIVAAIRASTLVIVLLSTRSVSRKGFAQKEIRLALDVMQEIPEGTAYLVPVRLDDCPIPQSLAHIHCGMLREQEDFERLVKALYAFSPAPESLEAVPTNYLRFQDQLDTNPRLIVPGFGASLVRLGQIDSDVLARLGKPPRESAFKDALFWSYQSKGVSIRFEGDQNRVAGIFLYRKGAEGYEGYDGVTPEGISVESSRRQIEEIYGRPTVTGGNGVINYWVSYRSHGLGATYATRDEHDLDAKIRNLSVAPARTT